MKIELPGWAQKDFMQFVEQLASAAGAHVPSQLLLLSSLGPLSRATAGDNMHGEHADWMHGFKGGSSSSWAMMLMARRGEIRGSSLADALPPRITHGSRTRVSYDAQHAALDEADATTRADASARVRDAVDAMPEAGTGAAPAAGAPQAIDDNAPGVREDYDGSDHVSMHEGAAAAGECAAHTAGSGGSPGSSSIRIPAIVERLQEAQGEWRTRGMAELDTAAPVPGLLFGASTAVPSAAQAGEYGTLPPITPLGNTGTWAAGREWVPPWPCMHAHEACDGPVHASVCEDGALRCVVWERRSRQIMEPHLSLIHI